MLEAYKWICQNCKRECLAYVRIVEGAQIDLPLCQCGAQTSIKLRGEGNWCEGAGCIMQGPSVTPISN